MSRVSHLVMLVTYVMGVVSIVIVLLFAVVPNLSGKVHLTTRGGLVFACTLFLCTIASYLVKTSGSQAKS